MRSTAPSYAYAYYPSSTSMFSVASDVHLNPSYDRLGDTNGFQNPAGEHGYLAMIHEVGHAIGLKHPHDGSPNLPSA
jgi:serralysin